MRPSQVRPSGAPRAPTEATSQRQDHHRDHPEDPRADAPARPRDGQPAPVHTRQEAQLALLEEQRWLTAQLRTLNARYHALDDVVFDDPLERHTREIAILDEELAVLRQAREVSADLRRLFPGLGA